MTERGILNYPEKQLKIVNWNIPFYFDTLRRTQYIVHVTITLEVRFSGGPFADRTTGGILLASTDSFPIFFPFTALNTVRHDTATMAAAIKAINARIRANPVSDYICSTRT